MYLGVFVSDSFWQAILRVCTVSTPLLCKPGRVEGYGGRSPPGWLTRGSYWFQEGLQAACVQI
jgi:hypothetical protein